MSSADNPHSVAVWVVLEIQERKPDGFLSGVPVKQSIHKVGFHFLNRQEAESQLPNILQGIKEGLKNASPL